MRHLFLSIFLCSYVFAHTPLLSCIDEGDGSVTCEGGFSDGSSAGGVAFRVEQGEKIVFSSKLNTSSEINFKKPTGSYNAVFDAGKEHVIYLPSNKIFQ